MINTAHTKTLVDTYVSKNYDKLDKIAQNILKKHQKQEESSNLISITYSYITDKLEKLNDKIINNEVEAIFVNHMSKQVHWGVTQFWNELNPKGKLTYIEEYDYDEAIDNEEFDDMIEREIEMENKLNYLNVIKYTLPLDERILFDLSITGPYNSSGKLSKYINLNRTCSYKMLKSLRDKVRKNYDDFN